MAQTRMQPSMIDASIGSPKATDDRWRTTAPAMPDGVPPTVVAFFENLRADRSVTYGEFCGVYSLLIETPMAIAGVRRFGSTRPGLWWDPTVFRSKSFSFAAYLSDVLARTRSLIEAECNLPVNVRLLKLLKRIDLDGTRLKAAPPKPTIDHPAPETPPVFHREPVAPPAIIYAGTTGRG